MAVPKRAAMRDWLYEVAGETARAARRALAAREPQRIVMTGASGSPTSALDRVAEKVIIGRLKDAPVPLNLCSEEVGTLDEGAEWTLIADPVDGTRNALHGIPFHAVSLAVGRRDLAGVEMGLVYGIPNGDDYWAEKGRGATHGGRRLKVRKLGVLEPLVGTALDYARGLRIPQGHKLHFRDLGSAALEMCFVAEGGLDGFLCARPIVRVVDVAASTLIVQEAGGEATALDGSPLKVPFDASKKFEIVAVGDPDLRRWLVP